MSLSRKRACLAGMAAAGATGSCSAFSAIPINNSVGRNGVVRSRVTRIGSAVDVQQRTRSSVAGNNSWSKSNERLLEPDALLLEPATVETLPALGQQQYLGGGVDAGGLLIGGVAAGGGGGDVERSQKQNKKKRKGKDPELVGGDALVNTPKMLALVYSSLGLNGLCLLQALTTIASPWQAVCTAAAAYIGFVVADLVSGVFHWSVDNYGNSDTPVFGYVIDAFQGHHVSPWTIVHRPFENNVHKICYAVLPLLALLRLVNPGPAGVAFGVTFLVGSLMSQEFHRYAHMTDPPAVVKFLQDRGVVLSRKRHGLHHSSPFEGKYCIVSGACNGALDRLRVFRFLERAIYELNGVEPIAWKLDPSLKEQTMATGWIPFLFKHQSTLVRETSVPSSPPPPSSSSPSPSS